MNKVFDYKKFYEEASKSPRLTTLYNKFESISEGLEQRPITIPKVDDAYLNLDSDFKRHDEIFNKNVRIFLKHGVSSIPYLTEEYIRVDKALLEYAKYKNATKENPLAYWETSSADGSRGRSLAEFCDGRIITLTDSPNLGNMNEFNNSPRHDYSYFYRGGFIDINPEFLQKQEYNEHFKNGFDIIWENTTFQMYGDNRWEQIAFLKQELKKDGIVIFFEKMNNENIDKYIEMEKTKDEFKNKYFNTEQILQKKANILNTMEKGQVTLKEFKNAAEEQFKYGIVIWNSTNFYEILASDSLDNIKLFLDNLKQAYVPIESRLEDKMVFTLWGDYKVNIDWRDNYEN